MSREVGAKVVLLSKKRVAKEKLKRNGVERNILKDKGRIHTECHSTRAHALDKSAVPAVRFARTRNLLE